MIQTIPQPPQWLNHFITFAEQDLPNENDRPDPNFLHLVDQAGRIVVLVPEPRHGRSMMKLMIFSNSFQAKAEHTFQTAENDFLTSR